MDTGGDQHDDGGEGATGALALIKAQVEPALHRRVKSHAAAEGMSIKDYILELVRRDLCEREGKERN